MKSVLTARSLALLVVAVACTTAPVTGRKEFNLVGDGTMNKLGQQTYAQELAKAKAADRNYLFGLDNYVYLGGGQVQLTR